MFLLPEPANSACLYPSYLSALEVIFNVMRSINPRFTYLLTYLSKYTFISATLLQINYLTLQVLSNPEIWIVSHVGKFSCRCYEIANINKEELTLSFKTSGTGSLDDLHHLLIRNVKIVL